MIPTDDVTNLVERLRQDAEMLKDDYQSNLTELSHGVVVKDAAKACEAAADLIEAQAQALSDANAEWDALDQSHRSIGRATRPRRKASHRRRNQAEGGREGGRVGGSDANWTNSEQIRLVTRARAFLAPTKKQQE